MRLLTAAAFVFLWGSAFNAARVAAVEWPPLWAIGIRFALCVPLLIPIWWWLGGAWPSRADRGRLVLMGLFGIGGYLGCAWVAVAHLESGIVALLTATAPLFVALGRRLGGERIPPRAWLGLALGWLGVAVLGLSRAADGLNGAEAFGVALGLLGALSQAIGVLAFAPARARVDPWTGNLVQTSVAAILLLCVASIAGGPPPAHVTAPLAAAMLYSIVAVGIGGYALLFVVMRQYPPATASALQLLAPPVAALIGWAILGERLGWGDLAGGAITLAGLALMFRAK